MASALAALAEAKQFFAQADPVFGERIESYTQYVRENDLFTTRALLPPQSNRALPSAEEQLGDRISGADRRGTPTGW